MAPFTTLDGTPRQEPLEWRADFREDADAALQGFLDYVDGPVMDWIARHRTVQDIRAQVDPGGTAAGDGSLVRTVSALDAVTGNLDAALARLERYRKHPDCGDSAEQVDAFINWLRAAAGGAASS